EPDRVGKELLNPMLVVGRGVLEVRLEVDLPVALGLDAAVPDAEEVAGLELADAFEKRLAGQAELEAQVVLEPVEVGLDRRQERQQRLDLGGEVEDAADLGVVERLDPEAVAGGEERLRLLVPEREG